MANTITITVLDSDSAVLAGATVTLGGASTLTDSNGQAIFNYTDLGFSAGIYTATATLSGYTSASVDVVLTDGSDTTGTITMTKEATVTSTIVSAVAAVAVTTLTEKIAALKVKLNAKIAATSNVWKKLGYQLLLVILDTGSEWAVEYVTKKIS